MDVKQAFCQSTLPPNDPQHWYKKAKKILEELVLTQYPNSPCLFHGTLIEGEPHICVGLYVKNIAYYSLSDAVEKKFKERMAEKVSAIKLMGTVSHFLGIKFQWKVDNEGEITCCLSQGAFIDNLIQLAQLENLQNSTPPTPYYNGLPVDVIKNKPPTDIVEHQTLETTYRFIIGSLNWLAISTHPDISTITNLLAQHQNKVSKAHLTSARYVV
eukprot:10101227-Ditylum_brightwellii.AAC.1